MSQLLGACNTLFGSVEQCLIHVWTPIVFQRTWRDVYFHELFHPALPSTCTPTRFSTISCSTLPFHPPLPSSTRRLALYLRSAILRASPLVIVFNTFRSSVCGTYTDAGCVVRPSAHAPPPSLDFPPMFLRTSPLPSTFARVVATDFDNTAVWF